MQLAPSAGKHGTAHSVKRAGKTDMQQVMVDFSLSKVSVERRMAHTHFPKYTNGTE